MTSVLTPGLSEPIIVRFEREHIERHSISQGRRVRTLATLRGLAAQLGGRSLAELEPSDIMAWQGVELKRGLSPNTLRNRESMVRAFIGWAYSAGVMSFEDMMRLKSVSPVRGARAHLRPRPFKKTEIERFREALAETYPLAPTEGHGSLMLPKYLERGGRFSAVVQSHARRLQVAAQVSLALEEGLRSKEIRELRMDQIHPDNAAVVVRTAKQDPGVERYREVPWTTHSRLAVEEWLEFRALLKSRHTSPWLMLTFDAPLAAQTHGHFEDRVLQRFDYCGTRFRWHRLRHTFATERLRAGMPLEKVQIMMGHARLEQTLAYAEIVNSDVTTHAEASESEFARNLGLEAA
jgi:site-specific recombinase XerD